MKFAISNIAWDPTIDNEVASFLSGTQIVGIELAPSRYFADPSHASPDEYSLICQSWIDRGLPVLSMQSLLYKRPDLQIFDKSKRELLIEHLLGLRLGAEVLNVGPMVFGGPKNRKSFGKPLPELWREAHEFFTQLSCSWPNSGPFLTLESNPREYGSEFLTTSREAYDFANTLPATFMQTHIDLGCAKLANENPIDILDYLEVLPGHIQVSEPYLIPLSRESVDIHRSFMKELKTREYAGIVTLEMTAPTSLDLLFQAIENFERLIA